MSPDLRHSALEEAHFVPDATIGGRTLRKMGPVTYVQLKRLRNPLVCGGLVTTQKEGIEVIDFENAENIAAILQFVYVHSAPIAEVNRAMQNPETFDEHVFEQLADISFADLSRDAEQITATVQRVAAAATESAKTSGQDTDDPNAPGPRG